MSNPFLKDLAEAKGSSPASKRSKAADAGNADRREVHSLSCLELTRGFLDHDLQLRQLQAAVTLAYSFEEKAPFAQLLLTAVQQWQSKHVKGRPHPYGACSAAVACSLLSEFRQDTECPTPLQHLLDTMLSGTDMSGVAREVSLCAARLNSKKTMVIVEFRAHVGSPLFAYHPTFQLFLAKHGGERLGMRPQGALARKASGRSS